MFENLPEMSVFGNDFCWKIDVFEKISNFRFNQVSFERVTVQPCSNPVITSPHLSTLKTKIFRFYIIFVNHWIKCIFVKNDIFDEKLTRIRNELKVSLITKSIQNKHIFALKNADKINFFSRTHVKLSCFWMENDIFGWPCSIFDRKYTVGLYRNSRFWSKIYICIFLNLLWLRRNSSFFLYDYFRIVSIKNVRIRDMNRKLGMLSQN